MNVAMTILNRKLAQWVHLTELVHHQHTAKDYLGTRRNYQSGTISKSRYTHWV